MTGQKFEWTAALQNGDEFHPVGVSYADDVSDRAEEAAMGHYRAWCRDAPEETVVLVRRPLAWWQVMQSRTPKPAVQEPTQWGSIVRARHFNFDGVLLLAYVPEPESTRDNKYSWYSNQDSWHAWSELSDVEVLRVGVGEAA